MIKIGFILGTRPEIIKLYSCINYCVKRNLAYFIINTDQHYDKNMRDIFFEELGLPKPHFSLNVGSGSHARMLASMLPAIEDVLLKEKPDVIVVEGDTNTVLAGGLVAAKLGIKVAHVEAGLRSYDRDMPEEYNRIIVDHCSDFLFAPTEKQQKILTSEGIPANLIHVTGNTIVDAVQEIVRHAQPPAYGYKYVLLTTHRPSNTDYPQTLEAILGAVQSICTQEDMHCIFPVHPRLNSKRKLFAKFDRIQLREPLGYSDLLQHIQGSEMIFTDSGGIQEESCILKKKCVILRINTERPETVEVGGAVLLDTVTQEDIQSKYRQLKARKVKWYNPFGDGRSGERIVSILSGVL